MTQILNQPSIINIRPSSDMAPETRVFCCSFLRQTTVDLYREKWHTLALVRFKELTRDYKSDRLEVFSNEFITLRKEIHHEFISYVLIASGEQLVSANQLAFNDLPDSWLEDFPGCLLTKVAIEFQSAEDGLEITKLNNYFEDNQLIGNLVESNTARIWTDFYAGSESGTLKVLVEDIALGPKRRGRLCQNVLDLENYRSLAAIGFPIAEEILFKLEADELALAKIVENTSYAIDTKSQQDLLHQLFDLSVKSENWRSKTAHRFSATGAYQKIFDDRLVNLDETRVLGYQSFSRYFNRNAQPSFRTCEAANDRLNVFIQRIDRAISLLSTRIRSTMEQQNNDLLTSMDEQNKRQMRLQETIEAFAIVAISYNASALINLLLTSLKENGVNVNVALWTLVSIPCTIVTSLLLMRYLHNKK